MRIARLNGLTCHWREDGPPDAPAHAPALVLAHSLGTDLRMFDGLVDRLPDWRCIRYDLRGHGLSEGPPGDYFMGDLVADAAALVEATAGGACVFCGISIGGVVAQGLAAERPDLVRGLVLMNTAGKIGTPELWAERVAAVRAQGVEAVADAVLERWFPPAWRAANADELAGWRTMLVRTPAAGYAGCAAALAETDLRDSTARLTLPTLVVAGSEDGSTPPDLVRELAADIEGARYELIRGAGHLPPIDAPDAVAAALRAFLATLP
jgi:3-oxoadipate enol-lactonase